MECFLGVLGQQIPDDETSEHEGNGGRLKGRSNEIHQHLPGADAYCEPSRRRQVTVITYYQTHFAIRPHLGYPFNRTDVKLGWWVALVQARIIRGPWASSRPGSETDADCLDYLEWLRWPAGFACAACGHDGAWRLGDGRFRCSGCGHRTSVTAGTIFDRTRTPLTVWFTACWLFATGKDGISALS